MFILHILSASTWGSPPQNKKALSYLVLYALYCPFHTFYIILYLAHQIRFACAVGLGPWSSPRPPSKHLHNTIHSVNNTIYSVNNTIYPVNIAWS